MQLHRFLAVHPGRPTALRGISVTWMPTAPCVVPALLHLGLLGAHGPLDPTTSILWIVIVDRPVPDRPMSSIAENAPRGLHFRDQQVCSIRATWLRVPPSLHQPVSSTRLIRGWVRRLVSTHVPHHGRAALLDVLHS